MIRASLRRGLVAILSAGFLAGCNSNRDPVVGPRAGEVPAVASGPAIVLLGAADAGGGKVAVSYRLTVDGQPASAAAETGLRPSWTLAALGTEPVSGLPAWRSLLLTGAEALPSGARQPGIDAGGAVTEQPDGVRVYTFASALPAAAAETLRVGVWLEGAPTPTPATSATLDFVPDGSALRSRELVRDDACAGCHGAAVRHHGKRTGARLCLTCHTYQNADADTVDPAALDGATPATDPNSLELGRLVHRLHRGRELPTLYAASSGDLAPALPSLAPLPLPFLPGRNAPVPGRKFSVIGELGQERVFGRIVQRVENGQPPRTVAEGIGFPRDDRDCDACHAGATDAPAALAGEVSRRSCQGCHPDVWFGAGLPDAVHLAHPGGPRADDTACRDCHVPSAAKPNPYAPIGDIHVALSRSPRHDRPVVRILAVRDLVPGKRPTVVFSVSDRNGPLSALDAPVPALDQAVPPSPVPRGLSRLSVVVGGPSAPDYAWTAGPVQGVVTTTLPVSEAVPLITPAAVDGTYSYTMNLVVPDSAAGTWAVAMEATRRSVATAPYDPATDAFSWPYTGEAVTEAADNAVEYVDVAAGVFPGGSPVARRAVVEQARCERCHLRLGVHGGKNRVEYCLVCHTPERTDWSRRPKDASGNVILGATYDGIEERSVQFKVLAHRLHTGARRGLAELSGIAPHVVYGYGGNAFFLDEARFPGDLARCTSCHADGTWRLEALPAGAPPTLANERGSVLHAGTLAHGAGEQATPPQQAACLGCHATSTAAWHAARYTSGASEQCLACHGAKGSSPVGKAHGL